jgi:predicted NBD/HSP70 family sugar kinase
LRLLFIISVVHRDVKALGQLTMLNLRQMFGAVDVGGTKTLLATFSESGELIKKVKFPTPSDYKKFQSELKQQLKNLGTPNYLISTVALPGKVDRSRGIGITFSHLPWSNVSIREFAESIFHSPVLIENDSKLAALSEAQRVINDYKKVLYVTISTGIGGGYVVNGQIDHNLEDNEVGQILIEYQGGLKRWEEFASGSAILERYGKPIKGITDKKELDAIAQNIAVGLIDLVATLTPDVVIVGGGVGEHLELFKDELEKELNLYKNSLINVPPVLKAQKAEEAVIYGCYLFGKSHYEKITH